jgi:hypothetical protein
MYLTLTTNEVITEAIGVPEEDDPEAKEEVLE